MVIACDCKPCNNEAYCDCQWGSDALPIQKATLCQEHANELWETINPLLQLNLAWYRIDKPGVITGKTMSLTNKELIQTLQERLCPEQATETKPLMEEIPPCPEIKDWGKKELIYFTIIVVVCILFPTVYALWRLGY